MATSLPVSLLSALNVSVTAASAPDKGKNLQDGFQSLLDLGVDTDAGRQAEKEALPNKRDDGRDIVATYMDAPKDVMAEIKPVDNMDDAIEVYVHNDTPEKEQTTESLPDETVPAEDAQVGNDGKDHAIKQPAENQAVSGNTSVSRKMTAPDTHTNGMAGIEVMAGIEKLADTIVNLLAVGGDASQQLTLGQFAGNAGNFREKLEGLSPDILRQLQTLLENIQQALQGQGKIADADKSGIASMFGQLVATLNRPVPVEEKTAGIENIMGKLQAFSDVLAAQSDVSADAAELIADNDNSKVDSPYKIPAFIAQATIPIAGDSKEEVAVQQNLAKADGLAGVAANVQAATKSEASFSGSGFSDTGGGRGDNPALALGLNRTTSQSSASQANGAAFSKLLQQTSQPVLEQVIFHVKSAVDGGSSKIHIQLHPAELGKLDIKLEVDSDGKTGITVTADNKNTLDLLQRDSRGLERALADAGLKADSGSLNFNLRGDGQDKNQHEQSQAALNYKQAMPEDEPLALDLLTRSYVVNLAEGLDIKI